MQLLLPVSYKNKFGYIDEPLMIYFLQEDSHSQTSNEEEKYIKADRNFYGYLDIYMHMVNVVVKDENEQNYYKNILNSWKYNHELDKALLNNDFELAERYFNLYRLTNRTSINDEIKYYSKVKPYKAIWLKVKRRLGM